MSLIIDALKRAQQLRLQGPEGSLIPNRPYFFRENRRDQKKRFIMIAIFLISLSIIFLLLLRPSSPPPAQTHQVALALGEKPLIPEMAPPPSGSQPDVKNVSPGEILFREEQTSYPIDPPQEIKPPEREKLSELIKKENLHDTPLFPLSAPSKTPLEEEPSSKSIGVKQEEKRDHSFRLNTLNHFNDGVRYFNQKEYFQAIQAYQKVIDQDPSYVEAYNNIGITYQKMGEVEKAFEAYQKAIEINPNYEKGYHNLGTLLLLQNRYEEAEEAFHKAIRINANNIESHLNLGILYKKKGAFEKAIESYQTTLAINPYHQEAHYNIALLYEQMGEFRLAMNHYQQFIKLSSESHPELVLRVQRHMNRLIQTGKVH